MDKARGEALGPAEKEAQVLERSKEKLKREAEKIITDFFDAALNLAEVAVAPATYKVFRAKVLRLGNDAIRDVKKNLDQNYQVLYTPSNEDVVEVRRPTVQPRKHLEG